MIARSLIIAMAVIAITFGALMYYLQVYGYYDEVTAADIGNVQLKGLSSGVPEDVMFENFKGIDSTSSPVRLRACFDTPLSQALLTETYVTYPDAEPLIAPGWFDCFDAEEIGDALQTGEAIAFLGVENIRYGIDRVVAVMPDGRGFMWQQINACGAVVFAGEPAPEGCPPAPESVQ